MNSLNKLISKFQPISLSDMDSVALMNRIDTKYQISAEKARFILSQLTEDYKVLQIGGKRNFKYRTIYFDTEEKLLLADHLRGKLNREKVRTREYLGSDKRFFELKMKTNKGRTVKSRVPKTADSEVIMAAEAEFLYSNSNLDASKLKPAIDVLFERTTLVSIEYKERITVDFGLSFVLNEKSVSVNELAIIEVKRDGESSAHTPILKTLKNSSIYPASMSKYCLGMILLNKTERYNNYKPKLLKLNKLALNGNIW